MAVIVLRPAATSARFWPVGKWLVVVACALTACGSPRPTAISTATAGPPSARPELTISPEIASTIQVRKQYGLRADEEWIRSLEGDPEAQAGIELFGIPLTAAERAAVASRRWSRDLLMQIGNYCRSVPDDCAGAYINLKGSGIRIDIAHDIELHRTVLSNLVADPNLVDVQDVEWSSAELDSFIALVEADEAWFATIGVEFVKAVHPVDRNVVRVDFKGPAREAAAAIEAHFGNPSWIKAQWVAPLPWAGARGDLLIRIRESDGRPGVRIKCDIQPELLAADEGFADAVIGADTTGVCTMNNIPATAYRVNILRWSEDYLATVDLGVPELRVTVTAAGAAIDVVIPR